MSVSEQNMQVGSSVIGADIVITGNIEASVDLHIEGRVIGDVTCATLILGENSAIKGKIKAERVRVSGSVEGAIETQDLAIEPSGRVAADVIYARLRVANGGFIEGQLKCKPLADSNADMGRLKLVEPAAQPVQTSQAQPQPMAMAQGKQKQKAIYIE